MSASRVIVAVLVTFVVMFVVPFPFYAGFEALGWVEMPEGVSPGQMIGSVAVQKIGVAIGFVLLFVLARPGLRGRWWPYAMLWWVMSAVAEIGQGLGPGYTMPEAAAGILSEAVYFPLSTVLVARILDR